ncbi:hypothetical protein GGTG_14256 [Gaeumannomyces tritici R3-111a-1]|uniref:Uncharacterized protein n=1 Tax=Gaeumannomyces tritici (strain R3-111a-1) TaxID=644352 RepID=J3PL19_GAET3|nr:hypothetical protein GGTG_14256 [Gaeumannomyces tritici R3-111a-1]EJT68165.1 hypothetical protein GGTG_14256 [Gaeumannomyces tritici R3-111a-1]
MCDSLNELEASVMISLGRANRGVGAAGLRRVRNPTLLARAMLNLGGSSSPSSASPLCDSHLSIPSTQSNTLLHGPAEQLAAQYGLALVEPSYSFTQRRWDEHVTALEPRRRPAAEPATWSATEYPPQGTRSDCPGFLAEMGGVSLCLTALTRHAMRATSTGGLTNKLTGRIGDTPVPEPGFRLRSGRSAAID